MVSLGMNSYEHDHKKSNLKSDFQNKMFYDAIP